MAGFLSSLGFGKKEPDFMQGIATPLPFPGFYGTKMKPVVDTLYFPVRGRSLLLRVGNPINENFGTMIGFRLNGSDHPSQGPPGAPGAPPQGPTRRMRLFRIGGYYHDKPSGVDLHASVDQSGAVHTKLRATRGRTQGVFAASVAGKNQSISLRRTGVQPWRNHVVARGDYRGDTWSAGLRCGTTPTGLGFAGGSCMKSLTHKLDVGGEVYADAYNWQKRRYPTVRPWLAYSLGAFWKQSDWMACAQYGGKGAQDLGYFTFIRQLSPHVSMASQLVVGPHFASALRVGAAIAMPRTKSQLKFSFTTTGKATTCWERRLLSTVKMQVTGQLDLWRFKSQQPSAGGGNKFGVYLQIGYIPPDVQHKTPCLMSWNVERDLPPQK